MLARCVQICLIVPLKGCSRRGVCAASLGNSIAQQPALCEPREPRQPCSHGPAIACLPLSLALQLGRLLARDGGSVERAQARIAAQMPLDAKKRLADIVVENDGSVEQLKAQVGGGGQLRVAASMLSRLWRDADSWPCY